VKSVDVRQRFLSHFQSSGHTAVPSASLVADDPTLLLVNAGMVPFKPYFLGQLTPPWKTATSAQKCVRTGDIDNVGQTTRHATFFQMMGNFSFGDYFKQGAIPYAWDLLTRPISDGGYGFAEDRLWVTVYLDDDEAADIWHRQVGIPLERIQRRGKADNFWSMGVPGPCGPSSEIYYDRGPQHGREGGPEADEDRYLEVWNLVFMQFERGPGTPGGGKDDYPVLGELPARNIDTGLGLERVACLLQDVDSVYDTDLLRPILDRAVQLTGAVYGKDQRGDVALRVVAEHARTAAMLIADGITPSNEGRGYVLRRLLRRSVRNVRLLGAQEPVVAELMASVRDTMAESFPEVATDFSRIEGVAVAEEAQFLQTLARGTQIFDTAARRSSERLSGADAFALHDTYGFPIDLTLEMASEAGLSVDTDAFTALMAEQRDRARADRKGKGIGNADLSAYRELFAGGGHGEPLQDVYGPLHRDTRVRGLLVNGASVPLVGEGEQVEVVLDLTPFYAESGGQGGDRGTLTSAGAVLEVLDTQTPVKGLVVHVARVSRGELRAGEPIRAEVDADWRLSACQAHSGTHLVHAALRQVLGPQALQAGSSNRPGYLRFDFSWAQALSAATRSEIEEVANLAVRKDLPVTLEVMSTEEAKASGAIALFGENYGERVRVLTMGGPWSRELCGGTHVQTTAQVGTLALLSESSIGSGVRRVEFASGFEGFRHLARERTLVASLSELLKAPGPDLPGRVEGLVTRVRDLEKELDRLRSAAATAGAGDLAGAATDVFGVSFVAHTAAEGTPADALRELAFSVRDRLPSQRPGVVALTGASGGKVQLVVVTNPMAREWGLKAGELVRIGAPLIGGGGGGKDDVAQGGGTRPEGQAEALATVEQHVGKRITGSV
jgi:alanyl-tRNA synthetase